MAENAECQVLEGIIEAVAGADWKVCTADVSPS